MDKKALKRSIKALREKREELVAQLDGVVDTATTESRDFTPDENVSRGRLEAQIESTKEQLELREDELRKLKKTERKDKQHAALVQTRKELGLSELPAGAVGGNVQVVNEHRIYERGNPAQSYVKDLCVVAYGPGAMGSQYFQSLERMQRHGLENHHHALEIEEKLSRKAEEERETAWRSAEGYFLRQMIEQRNPREQNRGSIGERGMSYRALSTALTAGGEFVPPAYLVAQWIKFLRAGRVVANCMQHEDLPDGTMEMYIPKVSAGASYTAQGVQNTNISMTDLETKYVTASVFTAAGGQIVSLQLMERSPIHFDTVLWGDLAAAQAQCMDLFVISGSGENGEPTGILNTAGINTITWSNESPTIEGYYGQTGLAKTEIAESIFRPATHQFMRPEFWEYIAQSFDANKRPLVVPSYNGPFDALQVAPDDAVAEGAVGRQLSLLNTFEDANLPKELGSGKNQDVAIITRGEENYLYESPVITRALPQTLGMQLSVLLQAYNYGAFTAARYPTANSVITGAAMASANRKFNE